MNHKTYQTTFVEYVKKLEFDEINLLIYISKLAIYYGSRNVTVSYLDVAYHLSLKEKGRGYAVAHIPSLLSLYFEEEGQYFPFFEKVQLRKNHLDFTLTQKFEEDSFHSFVKLMSSLSSKVISNINKHHAIYLYLKLREEYVQRDMVFEYSILMSTDQLKSVFGLGKRDYFDTCGFNRNKFEKHLLIPSIEEINCYDQSLSLSWEKIKENRFVTGYLFKCNLLKP